MLVVITSAVVAGLKMAEGIPFSVEHMASDEKWKCKYFICFIVDKKKTAEKLRHTSK